MKGVQDVVKPRIRIPGGEENIYSLVGRVSSVLRREGLLDLENEFVEKAVAVETYDEVLRLSQDYVEHENGEHHESETV